MYTDVLGWLLLSIVVGLARVGRLDIRAVGTVVLALVGVLLTAAFLGQRIINTILLWIPEEDSRGHLIVVVAAAVGGSALTYAVGVEPALGAFVVGILFARAGGIPEGARATFERMTLGVFAPVFFGVAGLNAGLGLLFDPIVAVVGMATLIIATIG